MAATIDLSMDPEHFKDLFYCEDPPAQAIRPVSPHDAPKNLTGPPITILVNDEPYIEPEEPVSQALTKMVPQNSSIINSQPTPILRLAIPNALSRSSKLKGLKHPIDYRLDDFSLVTDPEPTGSIIDIETPGVRWADPTFTNPAPSVRTLHLTTSSDALQLIKPSFKQGVMYSLQFSDLIFFGVSLHIGQKIIFDKKKLKTFNYRITRLRGRNVTIGDVEIIAFDNEGNYHTINDAFYPLTFQAPISIMSADLVATLKYTPIRTPSAPSTLDSFMSWIGTFTCI